MEFWGRKECAVRYICSFVIKINPWEKSVSNFFRFFSNFVIALKNNLFSSGVTGVVVQTHVLRGDLLSIGHVSIWSAFMMFNSIATSNIYISKTRFNRFWCFIFTWRSLSGWCGGSVRCSGGATRCGSSEFFFTGEFNLYPTRFRIKYFSFDQSCFQLRWSLRLFLMRQQISIWFLIFCWRGGKSEVCTGP